MSFSLFSFPPLLVLSPRDLSRSALALLLPHSRVGTLNWYFHDYSMSPFLSKQNDFSRSPSPTRFHFIIFRLCCWEVFSLCTLSVSCLNILHPTKRYVMDDMIILRWRVKHPTISVGAISYLLLPLISQNIYFASKMICFPLAFLLFFLLCHHSVSFVT